MCSLLSPEKRELVATEDMICRVGCFQGGAHEQVARAHLFAPDGIVRTVLQDPSQVFMAMLSPQCECHNPTKAKAPAAKRKNNKTKGRNKKRKRGEEEEEENYKCYIFGLCLCCSKALVKRKRGTKNRPSFDDQPYHEPISPLIQVPTPEEAERHRGVIILKPLKEKVQTLNEALSSWEHAGFALEVLWQPVTEGWYEIGGQFAQPLTQYIAGPLFRGNVKNGGPSMERYYQEIPKFWDPLFEWGLAPGYGPFLHFLDDQNQYHRALRQYIQRNNYGPYSLLQRIDAGVGISLRWAETTERIERGDPMATLLSFFIQDELADAVVEYLQPRCRCPVRDIDLAWYCAVSAVDDATKAHWSWIYDHLEQVFHATVAKLQSWGDYIG